ncbi:hypothetical protein V494_00168 [Pseudogymnoascus sp. VKM F-4513 (FW-928)]|nr:hypothetical protein V494_00168 [Pseudogymnoascus sp. VKM F-4513 (FW-928)]
MARLNASNLPAPVATNESHDGEEVQEEGNWEQFVYADRLIADSVVTEDQGETQFSLLLREQLDTERDQKDEDEGEGEEEEDDDEDVDENALNVINNATRTPGTSNQALEENEPQQPDPPLSMQKRVAGMLSGGIRLWSSGSRPIDNETSEDTSSSEARDDSMPPPSTTTSARKAPNKLSRPNVLHQPLNTYKPPPRSSGKKDVYELNASPKKAKTMPTRAHSGPAQGVKRKRNDAATGKRPSPTGKDPSPGLPGTASKKPEELQTRGSPRVTRSRGSGDIVEPIDYSKKVEDTAKRRLSGGAAHKELPAKESRRRNRKILQDEVDEPEDEDGPSTPSSKNRAEEDASSEDATSPPTLQKSPPVEKSPETAPSASNKGPQSGAAAGPSAATRGRTKKGKNATVKVKEEDQDFQDEGSGEDDGESEEEYEDEGIAPTDAENSRRRRSGERQEYIKSPHFGDDFIADSRIEEAIKLIKKLEMTSDDEAKTFLGKEIQVLTKNIISSYESIQGLDEHDDPDPAARTEALCSAARDLDRLEVTVRKIIEKRLCVPAELSTRDRKKGNAWRERMLTDLFMFVMPDIIRAAAAAIFTYGSNGPPSTFDLKEILRYISLVSRLLIVAEDPQNKDFRPIAVHNADYPIRKPYISIKPLLLKFEVQCKKELKHREEAAELKRRALIIEKERIAREETKWLEAEEARIKHLRRQEEINVEYNRKRMKLGLAPVPLASAQIPQNMQSSEAPQPSEPQQTQELNVTAHRIRAELEVSVLTKEVEELTKKLEAAERRAAKLRREEQLQLKGYDAEDVQDVDYERVEMFPAGNTHAPPPEPWTKTEYEVLIDGLRLETGPDKYPNIARRLDRSLDEIFEKAIEFKRTMMEGLYMKQGIPIDPWVEIIGNEMLPRGREE